MSKKQKVLIIEDDIYISEMYKIKFESEDFETIIMEDGIKGLKFLEKETVDIILLDIVMPQVDGFSILKTIKNNNSIKNIPVVLLTNLSQKENIEKGFELGANSYIIKAQFTPSEVVVKIKEILKNK